MKTRRKSKTKTPRALRTVCGIRAPSGSCQVDGCHISWQQVPAQDSKSPQSQPILCLHPIGSGSREFHPLLQRCPIGSRLILFDWPGHGSSGKQADSIPAEANTLLDRSVRQLGALLNQLGLTSPILLGSGFGAAAAIRYASRHPKRIAGLVLCQPAGLIPGESSCGLAQLRRKLTGSITLNPAKRQALRLQVTEPELRELIAEAESALEHAQLTLRGALATVFCPILFALSRDSQEFKLRKYLELLNPLLASTPQHQFTVFTGSYNPMWDEPARFAQALTGFVQAQLPLHRHQHAWLLAAVDWPATGLNLWKCVHPDCPHEQTLSSGQNPNESP